MKHTVVEGMNCQEKLSKHSGWLDRLDGKIEEIGLQVKGVELAVKKDMVTYTMLRQALEDTGQEYDKRVQQHVKGMQEYVKREVQEFVGREEMKEKLMEKVSVVDHNRSVDNMSTKFNILKETTSKEFDQVRGEMNAKLRTKADNDRINEILASSISKSDLDSIYEKLTFLTDRITTIESDLKSNSHSDAGSNGEGDEDYQHDDFEHDEEEVSEYKDDYQSNQSSKVDHEQTIVRSKFSSQGLQKSRRNNRNTPKEVQFLKASKESELNSKLNPDHYDDVQTPVSKGTVRYDRLDSNSKSVEKKFKVVRSSNRSPLVNSKISHKMSPKMSQNMLKNEKPTESSVTSACNDEIRDSSDYPVELTTNDRSKPALLRQNLKQNIKSKVSFEAHLTTKESSTSSLINKLRIRPDKNNKSKKVSRSEIESMMKVMSEILIKVNNNRMRLDTLEGNVELKIDSLVSQFKTSAEAEIQELHEDVKKDVDKIYKRQGELERMTLRLSNKISRTPPHQHGEEIKAKLEQDKHDILVSNIAELKTTVKRLLMKSEKKTEQKAEEKPEINLQTFGSTANSPRVAVEIDYENLKTTMLQADINALKQQISEETAAMSKALVRLEQTIDDYRDKIDYQVYEFKSQTTQQMNNFSRESESVDRALSKFHKLYNEILSEYVKTVDKNSKQDHDAEVERRRDRERIKAANKGHKAKSRIHSISPVHSLIVKKHTKIEKNLENDRYKMSKSVLEKDNLKSIRIRSELRAKNQSGDTMISGKLSTIINKAYASPIKSLLPDVKNEKQLKILKKFTSEDAKSLLKSKGKGATPASLGFASKVHVNLHSLF